MWDLKAHDAISSLYTCRQMSEKKARSVWAIIRTLGNLGGTWKAGDGPAAWTAPGGPPSWRPRREVCRSGAPAQESWREGATFSCVYFCLNNLLNYLFHSPPGAFQFKKINFPKVIGIDQFLERQTLRWRLASREFSGLHAHSHC